MAQCLTKTAEITFTNGQTRKVEYVEIQNGGTFLVFVLPGGGEMHVMMHTVQTMDMSAVELVRNTLIA